MRRMFMKKAPKELTDEENKELLSEVGVSTHKSSRQSKFSAFQQVAKDVAQGSGRDFNIKDKTFSPSKLFGSSERSEPPEQSKYANASYADSNPYASTSHTSSRSNPYASNPSTNSNPYASKQSSNPYASSADQNNSSNQYSSNPHSSNQYKQHNKASNSNPYASNQSSNPYSSSQDGLDELNEMPSERAELPSHNFDEDDELLHMPSELAPNEPEPERDHEGSDEEADIEDIKRQIKFTKKESIDSTRNALRVAAEAEASGKNALGMLGSQGERVANTERSLALAENQTKVAELKARELARLQRSIFVPNVSNPFTSKRRLEAKEAQIKSDHLQEQVKREHRRQMAYESEQRVLGGLTATDPASQTALKYQKQRQLSSDAHQKYQFEADSEDELLESELELNLKSLEKASGRLHNLGISMNEEIKTQNRRLNNVVDVTDRLDVDVHLNSARMASLK